MIIAWREIKANSRSFLVWTVSLAIFNFAMMMLYPSFADEAGGLADFIEMLPQEFLRAFGLDRLSLSDIMGYYATEGYLVFILASSLYAVLLSSSLLAKEESDKTIEFLLARPVTRSQVVLNKLLALTVLLFVLNTIVSLTTWAGFELYKREAYHMATLGWLFLAPFLAQMTFAMISLLLSLFVTRKRNVYASGIGLVLLLYFISFFVELNDKLRFLGYLTPFKYANAADIVTRQSMRTGDLLILLGVIGLTVLAVFLIYRRKNIAI